MKSNVAITDLTSIHLVGQRLQTGFDSFLLIFDFCLTLCFFEQISLVANKFNVQY